MNAVWSTRLHSRRDHRQTLRWRLQCQVRTFSWNRRSPAPSAAIRKPRPCRPTHASGSMNALGAEPCYARRRATVACSALTAACHAHRSKATTDVAKQNPTELERALHFVQVHAYGSFGSTFCLRVLRSFFFPLGGVGNDLGKTSRKSMSKPPSQDGAIVR